MSVQLHWIDFLTLRVMSKRHVHHHDQSTKNIKVAFFLNLFFTVFEIIGGMYVNSVAILSDALHDFGDSLSLGLSWYLDKKSKKAADKNFTFGYQRFSLLSALINSIVLIIGSVFVIQEAVERLIHPESSNGLGMMYIAIVGVIVNAYAAYKLSHGKSMNEKVLSWHLVEDVLGWVAVLIVSIVLIFKDIPYLDPALSLAITAYILWNVVKRLKETLMLFLQGTPLDFDVDELTTKILEFDQVVSVHNTYLWSLDGEHHVFSAHVVIHKVVALEHIEVLKEEIRARLKAFGLSNITIEIEFDESE